jgi:hypothetical protein
VTSSPVGDRLVVPQVARGGHEGHRVVPGAGLRPARGAVARAGRAPRPVPASRVRVADRCPLGAAGPRVGSLVRRRRGPRPASRRRRGPRRARRGRSRGPRRAARRGQVAGPRIAVAPLAFSGQRRRGQARRGGAQSVGARRRQGTTGDHRIARARIGPPRRGERVGPPRASARVVRPEPAQVARRAAVAGIVAIVGQHATPVRGTRAPRARIVLPHGTPGSRTPRSPTAWNPPSWIG